MMIMMMMLKALEWVVTLANLFGNMNQAQRARSMTYDPEYLAYLRSQQWPEVPTVAERMQNDVSGAVGAVKKLPGMIGRLWDQYKSRPALEYNSNDGSFSGMMADPYNLAKGAGAAVKDFLQNDPGQKTMDYAKETYIDPAMEAGQKYSQAIGGYMDAGKSRLFGNKAEYAKSLDRARQNAAEGNWKLGEFALNATDAGLLKGMAMAGVGTIVGVGAKNVDKAALEVAKKMAKAGKDAADIWYETGWFKSVDGNWKTEISDAPAKIRTQQEIKELADANLARRRALLDKVNENNKNLKIQPDLFPKELSKAHGEMKKEALAIKLAEDQRGSASWAAMGPGFAARSDVLVDHPELWANYPELGSTMVSRGGSGRGYKASHRPGYIDIYDEGLENDRGLSSWLHENQHAVQAHEGFARGGNSGAMRDELWQEAERLRNEIQAHNVELQQLSRSGDKNAYNAVMDSKLRLVEDYQNISDNMDEMSIENYKRLAGEVEARNVQARAGYPEKQRKLLPPEDTQDYTNDQQLIRFRNDIQASEGDSAILPDSRPFKQIGNEPLPGLDVVRNIPNYGNVKIGPNPAAEQAAIDHAAKSGIPYTPHNIYAPIDKEFAAKVAREYDLMKHDPQNPLVREAYGDLKNEMYGQFEEMLRQGIKPVFDKSPYSQNPWEALADMHENKRLKVYPTDEGFGTGAEFDPTDNPLLAMSPYKFEGVPAMDNDIFRAVHDWQGHAKGGFGFRAPGEDNAYFSHAGTLSDMARKAVATETRGQNSWLNYGPFGDTNRTAKVENTIFADQKTGLLPNWVIEKGGVSQNARQKIWDGLVSAHNTGLEGAINPDGTITLIHRTPATLPGGRVDPAFYGRNLSGRNRSERARSLDPNFVPRTFWGLETAQNPYKPEAGLGSNKYVAKINGADIYDVQKDSLGLWQKGGGDPTKAEKEIWKSGHSGYIFDHPELGKVVQLFDPVDATKKLIIPIVALGAVGSQLPATEQEQTYEY